MTVSSSTNRVSYSGNGTLTVFAYTFKVFDENDLTVILRASDGTETVQTITTHYTVSGVGDANGGNVTFVTAPTATETVVILREQPLTQGLDLVPNDPFPAASLEDALDKLVFMSQKHEEELSRAIKASKGNTITGSEFTISAADRANRVFAFDSSGDLSITKELGIWRGDWAASTDYNERDLVRDTSDGSIYIVNSAHTSSGSEPLDTNTNSAKYDVIFDVGAMIAGTVTMDTLSVNGNTTLGDAATDTVTVNADIASDLIPSATETYDLGSSTARWQLIYGNLGLFSGTLSVGSTAVIDGKLTLEDDLEVRNDTILGSSWGDTVAVNARVTSDIVPNTDNTYDLGNATNQWAYLYVNNRGYIDTIDTNTLEIDIGALGGSISSKSGYALRFYGDQGIRMDVRSGNSVILQDGGDINTYGAFENNSGHLRIQTGSSLTDALTFAAGGAVTAEYNFTVDGTATFNGQMAVAYRADFNSTADATSTTTGSVVVDGGVGIAKSLHVGQNVVVGGNLTVNGTTTTVDSNTVNIGDSIITLNSDETGTPTQSGGFEIERGTSPNVQFVWNETNDIWTNSGYPMKLSSLEFAPYQTTGAAKIKLDANNTAVGTGPVSSVQIASFDKTTFAGGKLLIVAAETVGTDTQATEVLLCHDGTTVTSTQYGNVRTSASDLATYTFAISGSNLNVTANGTLSNIDFNVSLMLGANT